MDAATVESAPRAPWPLARREELANAITHGLGAALAVAGLVLLVVFASLRGTARHIVGAALFGSSMVLLYVMSTLYHSFRGPRVKKVFRILDHSSIYVLIAGTYTPLCLATIRGAWGWSLFGVIWGLAVLGITFKAIFIHRWEWLSLAVYLLMGWLVVIAILPLWRAMPAPGLAWLFGGGLFYTGGAVFYAWRRLPYHHALWHLCVIGGTACHFACVLGWVIPGRA
ncbi:MAG: hemolysin III family protein [Acidobacteria bacterium]|nr:hemolysin III family protein [Acidobacteriota bacterium]